MKGPTRTRRYLAISHSRCDEFTIRVSDHADAYASAGYTCDGIEGTLAGAKLFILRALNTSERAMRRLRKARAAAKCRDLAARRSAWVVGYASQNGVTEEVAISKLPYFLR